MVFPLPFQPSNREILAKQGTVAPGTLETLVTGLPGGGVGGEVKGPGLWNSLRVFMIVI